MRSYDLYFRRIFDTVRNASDMQADLLFAALLCAVMFLDFTSPYQIQLFIAYMIPVAVLVLRGRIRMAYMMALICPFISELSDYFGGKPYTDALAVYWTFFIRISCLLLFVTMLSIALRMYERYRGYFELGMIGVAFIGTDGRILDANDHLHNLMGYGPGELLAKTLDALQPHGTENLKELLDRATRAEGHPRSSEQEMPLTRRGGSTFIAHIAVRPVLDMARATVGFLATVQDITESRQLKDTLVQNEKMMSLGRIASGIAHQINNPLSGILQSTHVVAARLSTPLPANLEAAKQAGCSFESLQAYLTARDIPVMLGLIKDSAQRVSAIVSGMLEFSRKDTSPPTLNDVNRLLDKAAEMYMVDHRASQQTPGKVAIDRRYAEGGLACLCHPVQLQQAFYNIVSNAIHALENTPSPRLTIRTRRLDGSIVIEFEDNGPGISQEAQRVLFDPFFTTKPAGKGTGLGLFVAYFIIRNNHGGDIRVESAPGEGATFTLTLPAA